MKSEEKKISKSSYVFNLVEPSRTRFHRHYTAKCSVCGTFLVYQCEKTSEFDCDGKTHGLTELPDYPRHDSQLPDEILRSKESFQPSECDEHFAK